LFDWGGGTGGGKFNSVNVMKAIDNLRAQKPGMVTDMDMYEFCYVMVHEYIKRMPKVDARTQNPVLASMSTQSFSATPPLNRTGSASDIRRNTVTKTAPPPSAIRTSQIEIELPSLPVQPTQFSQLPPSVISYNNNSHIAPPQVTTATVTKPPPVKSTIPPPLTVPTFPPPLSTIDLPMPMNLPPPLTELNLPPPVPPPQSNKSFLLLQQQQQPVENPPPLPARNVAFPAQYVKQTTSTSVSGPPLPPRF